ncbi:MAG: tetratricopeptide repeat protein [Candidatus Omnitrophica bacterium]|nr:tetratricopeptide repeat protein [Candidatus Omnitrophota bacterium]
MENKSFFAGLVLIFFSVTVQSPVFASDSLKYVLEGIQDYYESKDSIAELKEDIEANPSNPDNYIALAYIYDTIGLYNEEVKMLNKAAELILDSDKEKDLIYLSIGEAYIKLNKWSKARSFIEKALSLNPENIQTLGTLAKAKLYERDFKGAAKLIKQLSVKEKELDIYYDFYIYSLELFAGFDGPREFFEACAKTDPDNYMARRAYGVALRGLGDSSDEMFAKAIKEMERALELNPQYIPTYISLADSYMLRGFHKKDDNLFVFAQEWFDKGYKINPKDLRLSYAMGNFFLYKKDYYKAIEKLEFALEGGLEDIQVVNLLTEAYNNQAYSLYKEGKDLEKGLVLIDKALKMSPYNGILIGTKAELLYKLGRYNEAFTMIKRALQLEPDNAELRDDYNRILSSLQSKEGEKNGKKGYEKLKAPLGDIIEESSDDPVINFEK